LLAAVELATVISIAAFIGYIVYGLMFSGGPPSQTRAAEILEVLDANWRVLLIIVIPLFYRVVRKFIEELQELGPARRQVQTQERPLPPQRVETPPQGEQ
jgi:hypothetical protein